MFMDMHDENLYSWRQEHTEIPEFTFPVNVFHIHFPDRYLIPPHWHDHLEWIYITKGSFQVQIGSDSRQLHAGEAAWVNRRQMHSAHPMEHGSELYAIVYNEVLLKGVQDYTEVQYIQPLLGGEVSLPLFYDRDLPMSDMVRESLERLIMLHHEQSPGYELRFKGELLSLLGLAFQQTKQRKRNQHIRLDTGIHPLLAHLSNHFHEPITIEQAARMCCVTPNYFCSLFKKTTGTTLIKYIHMLRVYEACRLLQLQRYSVQDVASQVGFSNLTYFGRVFKSFTGMSPRQYMTHSLLAKT